MLFKGRSWLLIPIMCTIIACGQHTHPDKKIFRYNESSGITSLDPLKATNLSNIWAVQQIYEGLFLIDSSGSLQPLLVDTWTVNDSLTEYNFILKKNVFFHKDECFGRLPKKMTAHDVVYSFQRILGSSSSWVLQNIELDSRNGAPHILIKDSFEFKIYLKEPSKTFPQMLAIPVCGIIPKEAVEKYGADLRRHPVGTGPFIFKVWHENEKLILHKNPNYHLQGLPLIDAISISFLKDKQTALLEFIRGKFDLLSGIDAAYKDELLTADGNLKTKYNRFIRLSKQPYLNTEYLGIQLEDVGESPLGDVHIRKALNYGLDRNKLITYIRNGIGISGSRGIIPPMLFSDTIEGYSYNKQKFDEEIKLSSYRNVSSVPFITLSADVAYTDICTFIANQWNELGLKIRLDILDRPTLKSEIAKGNISFFRASWIADYPDPENYLSLFYGPLKSPAGPNYTHFSNDSYDTLYRQILSSGNDSIRLNNFSVMEKLIYDQSPVIILYYDQVVRFINKRIHDLPPHPMNYLDLRKVDIAYR
jgi:ABC-type transport system substrate-binding protein